MKQTETKILAALIVIILVVGAILIFAKGLAFELKYQESQKVEINIGKEFENSDIKQITDEIFKNQTVKIQAIEVYKDALSLTTTEISEEQKEELVTKINEKYETEINAEDIEIEEVTHTRARNIIKPYIVPFVVSTIIILIYLVIRYHKLNCLEVLSQSIGIIGLSQLVLLGIMAITRMPIGRFTIPTVLVVYVLSIYIATTKFNQYLNEKVTKENKKKNK